MKTGNSVEKGVGGGGRGGGRGQGVMDVGKWHLQKCDLIIIVKGVWKISFIFENIDGGR